MAATSALTTLTSSVTMTSREIAELTNKQHKNVLRDIDVLLESLGSDLSQGFKTSTYKDSTGKENRQYEMDRDSTFCVVAGYDANARMRIIKRWQELEAQAAKPEEEVLVTISGSWKTYALFLEQKTGHCYRALIQPAPATSSPRPVTPEEEFEVIERYTAGESKYAIGKALKRNGKTINRILARANRAESGTAAPEVCS